LGHGDTGVGHAGDAIRRLVPRGQRECLRGLQPLQDADSLLDQLLYTVACIQNLSCAVLMLPSLSKYQSSHSSAVDFK
jgi:hypothetical protein